MQSETAFYLPKFMVSDHTVSLQQYFMYSCSDTMFNTEHTQSE